MDKNNDENSLNNDEDEIQGSEDLSTEIEQVEENMYSDDENTYAYKTGHSTESNHEDGDVELEDFDASSNPVGEECNIITIDGLEDMGNVNFKILRGCDVKNYNFANRDVAYTFYNMYARMNGFSARKNKVWKRKNGEIIQQNFVCHKQGRRKDRFGNVRIRKREPMKDIRCGCKAECRVHIDSLSNRWYVKFFYDEHNHLLVRDKHVGFLSCHQKINEDDLTQMTNMRRIGISTGHVFASLASQMGGYERVGFTKEAMHNEFDKQRRKELPDARGALAYLRSLRCSDPDMYWRHVTNEKSVLVQLFWSDGQCQKDYLLFGDVVAFDATYKKNKYGCPLVVFCGVNHHNKTIIFGAAIVSNEKEETYVWVLEQFLNAMKGKMPLSVITDGDIAMKNAIRRVFTTSRHRLCAWHLLMNAKSHVKNPDFLPLLKNCMFGDYNIDEFETKWDAMVLKCELEDNKWVKEMHEKRHMWATAHIRGSFFGGFRTTSRAEGLHSQLGRYVNFHNNLRDFLENFQECCSYFRFKEVHNDFSSVHGAQVLLTDYRRLERSASNVYTKEVFILFRSVLQRSSKFRVDYNKRTANCKIYFVSKYCSNDKQWSVNYCPSTSNFRCSCLKMESQGIPCEHIVAVIKLLNMVEMPKSLILDRWTKYVKESTYGYGEGEASGCDPFKMSRHAALTEISRQINKIACLTQGDFDDTKTVMLAHYDKLKAKNVVNVGGASNAEGSSEVHVRNPENVATKGSGLHLATRISNGRRPLHCSICRGLGHNRKTCSMRTQVPTQETFYGSGPSQLHTEDDHDMNGQ